MPFTYQLQMGDQIEIITQKQPNPSRDWLNPNLGYVTTSRGRSKIHAWFRKQDRDKNILAGRQILDDELEHLGISLKEAENICCRVTTSMMSTSCWRRLVAGYPSQSDGELPAIAI